MFCIFNVRLSSFFPDQVYQRVINYKCSFYMVISFNKTAHCWLNFPMLLFETINKPNLYLISKFSLWLMLCFTLAKLLTCKFTSNISIIPFILLKYMCLCAFFQTSTLIYDHGFALDKQCASTCNNHHQPGKMYRPSTFWFCVSSNPEIAVIVKVKCSYFTSIFE